MIWRDENENAADALFEARDRIDELEQIKLTQGARLIQLAVENCAWRDSAEGVIAERYRRTSDVLHAIEHFTFTCRARNTRIIPQIAEGLMRDAIEYGEGRALSPLLAWAMRDAYRDAALDGAS